MVKNLQRIVLKGKMLYISNGKSGNHTSSKNSVSEEFSFNVKNLLPQTEPEISDNKPRYSHFYSIILYKYV